MRAANSVRKTLLMTDDFQNRSEGIQQENKPVSPLLFYLIFLLASGFLWLAPKI
jgi:hypothetical protein